MIPFKRPTATMYNKCLFSGGGVAPQIGGTAAAVSTKKPSKIINTSSSSSSSSSSNDIIKETPSRLTSKFPLETITNIKELKTNMTELIDPHEHICQCIVSVIISPEAHLKYDELRERLYDLLTYDINIQECVWFILRRLITTGILLPEMMDDIMTQIYTFFQYFNNNYRPIYHLENFVLLLVCKIHGYKHQFPPLSIPPPPSSSNV
jgi:pantothenate kinase